MEKEVSNIILGIASRADRFTVKYGWFRFRLSIRPLTVRQMIEISAELSRIKNVDTEKEMYQALNEGISDLKYVARAIAIATGTRFRKAVTSALLDLPLADLQTLFALVKKQSDMERFFFIMISTKGMNLLRKTTQEEQ